MATENVKINMDIEAKSLSSLINDADSLRTALNKATDPDEVKKLNDEFDKTKTKIKDIEKASKFNLADTFEEANGEVQPLNTRLGELEDRMYELAFAGKANTEEFKAMQAEASNMRKSIIDVDRQVDLMAENKGIGVFGAGLNNLGDSIMNLDFETAAQDASKLAAASQAMSFSSATKSIKQLGSTFANLGKALLTNPIFLIAAVIAGVVAVVVALMDELGLLEVIMDAVGKVFEWIMIPINAIIDGLKALTDWFGWTNNAAEEAAEAQAEAAKKAADAQEKSSTRITQALDNEIALMKAGGELSDEEFAKMQALEAQKRIELDKTAKARMDEAQAALDAAVLKGDLDEEELQALKDTLEERELAWKQTQANIEIGHKQAITDRKAREDAAAEEAEKKQDDADKKEEARQDKKRAAYETYQENRLNAERQIQDLILETMEEGTEKELAEINTKYDRLIEDAKANEELTQAERLKILEHYQKLREQKIDEVDARIKAKDDEKEAAKEAKLKEQNELLNQIRNTDMENELLAIEEEYAAKLELAKGNAELEKELLKQIEADKEAIRQGYRDEQAAKEQELKDKEVAMEEKAAKEKEAMQKANIDGAISAANGLLDAIIANTEEGSKAQENALVAQAIMQGALGAVGAISQSISQLGPIAGPIVGGVLAAGIAATTVANINNIKSARKGGTSSGGGGNVPTPSVPETPTETPSVNLFGEGTGGSGGDSSMFDSQNNNNNQPQTVKAVVQWSDIEDVQNSDDNLQNEMQL